MSVDVPSTVWRATDGLSEYSSEGINDIVDPSGNFLVDPSGNQIIDTGVVNTRIPATVWTEDDNE